jgi:hypothetical protein
VTAPGVADAGEAKDAEATEKTSSAMTKFTETMMTTIPSNSLLWRPTVTDTQTTEKAMAQTAEEGVALREVAEGAIVVENVAAAEVEQVVEAGEVANSTRRTRLSKRWADEI